MVNGRHRRITDAGQSQQPVSETLIVMNNVVSRAGGTQIFINPHPERPRLRKTTQAHAEKFQLVHRRNKIPIFSRSEQVLGVVQVQARHFIKTDMLDRLRVRRAGNHIHLMAQVTKRPAEIFDINALPATGRITPVGQKAYF